MSATGGLHLHCLVYTNSFFLVDGPQLNYVKKMGEKDEEIEPSKLHFNTEIFKTDMLLH